MSRSLEFQCLESYAWRHSFELRYYPQEALSSQLAPGQHLSHPPPCKETGRPTSQPRNPAAWRAAKRAALLRQPRPGGWYFRYIVLSKYFVSAAKQGALCTSSYLIAITCLESPLQLRRLKLATRKYNLK